MSPAGRFRHGEIVSLWDMLRIYADKFIFTINTLAALPRELDKHAPETPIILSDNDGRLGPGLRGMVGLFTELEMPVSKRDAEALLHMYDHREQKEAGVVSTVISTLCASVATEFEGRLLIATTMSGAQLFKPEEPLFGKEVETKFGEMSEDISEAGKCLAIERATASVFHLMRVMERALQRFGTAINVALAGEKNWQNILDEINKKIKVMDQKDPLAKKYAGAASHLYNVKLAWRNEVMHPKQTYTAAEANNVFSSVRAFVQDLAKIL